ncbi:hypothetical protein OC846_005424 [Tilletia horrida]|uniref:C2 domain-containing protein n=1 Tax=Tilletia horrida TaxID=155126 RepID=A0AAN6GNC6_9BASI|nr:hypothetical protein OC846_005424 [Tilletia horrida]KAK0567300.1 hypothetical protein OC861_002804 [Tilletia horrida]
MAPLPEPQKKGTLVCVVLKARNLPNKRSIGKQDPYCVLTLNQEALKTKPDKRGGQHPQWDEQLHFDIYEDLEELLAKEELALDAATTGSISANSSRPKHKPAKKVMKVTCYADDQREPEFIGEGIVDLTETLKSGEFDEWVPLQAKDRYAGEVYLELTYYLDKAPPKKKKAPKPVVGSSTGGTSGESYGGAGVFVGEVDEDPSDGPPRPPSKHMPRPSNSSAALTLPDSSDRRGGNGHGSRSDRLSMTGSASFNNLLSAPGSGGSASRSNSPASTRRQSDVPASLRPSSSLANFDMYTPPYAQQALQRIPSPAPPGNDSTASQHQQAPHRPPSSQGQPRHSYGGPSSQSASEATSQANPHARTGHTPRPSVASTNLSLSSDPYADAANEIARSMAALSFNTTVAAPIAQHGQPSPYPSAAPTPAPPAGTGPFSLYSYPPPSTTPTPAMMAQGHGGQPQQGAGAIPPGFSPYQQPPPAGPVAQFQPGGVYAQHSTPPTLHGHYPLPPPGPGVHSTPPHQLHSGAQQPLRQSSYPLASNSTVGGPPASAMSASSTNLAAPYQHQFNAHSAPATPAHDLSPAAGPAPLGGPAVGNSPASFHALPALPPAQPTPPRASPSPYPLPPAQNNYVPQQQQQHPHQPPPPPQQYHQGPPPPQAGLVPAAAPDYRSSSPAPSMASLASMSSFQTYTSVPQQQPQYGGPVYQQQAAPPPSAPMGQYGQQPPQQQQPPHLYNTPPPSHPSNGLPAGSGTLPYSYSNGPANGGAYGQQQQQLPQQQMYQTAGPQHANAPPPQGQGNYYNVPPPGPTGGPAPPPVQPPQQYSYQQQQQPYYGQY